jgi:hypothetical protein
VLKLEGDSAQNFLDVVQNVGVAPLLDISLANFCEDARQRFFN